MFDSQKEMPSAFNVISGKSKNVYTAIVGQLSVRDRINNYQMKKGNGLVLLLKILRKLI